MFLLPYLFFVKGNLLWVIIFITMDPISMDLDIYVYNNLHAENKEDVIAKIRDYIC